MINLLPSISRQASRRYSTTALGQALAAKHANATLRTRAGSSARQRPVEAGRALPSPNQHRFYRATVPRADSTPASRTGLASSADFSDMISPIILSRARRDGATHARLTAQLSEQYDQETAKRASAVAGVANALTEWDRAAEAIGELRALAADEDDAIRVLAATDLPTAQEELEAVAARLQAALAPKHPWQDLPCLLEIRPGAGGSEAGLFANELVRMYHQFCTRRGMPVNVLKYDVSTGDAGERVGPAGGGGGGGGGPESSGEGSSGAKIVLGDHSAQLIEAVLEVPMAGAYDILRTEAGVHRVQRVPETESKGRTHTSSAAVVVLPSFSSAAGAADESGGNGSQQAADPDDLYYIDPREVRTEVMRARGAGGQHVNKTESAVRLTHTPTGITVSMQDERSQPRNKARAWQVLRARLAARRLEARQDAARALRRSIVRPDRIGRENKIRTYNWQQQRVTDHRSGLTVTSALDDVMRGGESLDRFVESVRSWMVDTELADMLAEEEGEDAK